MTARGTAYPFISTDTDALTTLLTTAYERITGTTVRPASPERLFIQWMSSILVQERVQNNYAGSQNIPSRAVGENLDALAELTHCRPRPEAAPAGCMMRFYVSQPLPTALIVPAGTRVTDAAGSLVWATEAEACIPIGETSVETLARCQTAGTVGNGFLPGQINTIVDLYDYYTACENITASDGGADRATDEEYYELMRASMDAYSCAGAKGSYIYFAKQVSTEIADVIAASPVPGVVKLYVLMRDGTLAGDEIKRAVLNACSADEVRPLTDQVFVEDAEIVPFDISFAYYIQSGGGKSAADIAAAVQQAVERYKAWQCAKLGRDINPDELREYLYHTGVKRIELASPAFTALRDGRDKLTPQVAAVGTVTITNGGYEDE